MFTMRLNVLCNGRKNSFGWRHLRPGMPGMALCLIHNTRRKPPLNPLCKTLAIRIV